MESCRRELAGLNYDQMRYVDSAFEPPETLVFGHTHQPVPYDPDGPAFDEKIGIEYCNTGSWITDADGDFLGAEIVLYDSEEGLRSVSVREEEISRRL